MKIIYNTLISLLLLLTMACGSEQEEENLTTDTPISVKTVKVNSSGTYHYVSASGTIQAAKSANISTRMMGYVDQVHVKVGQDVNKGDLLIQINSKDLAAKKLQIEAQIHQARSAYDNASKDLDRFNKLHAKGSASDKELENITTHFEVAKGNLEAAEEMKNELMAQFEYLSIRAPFSGKVMNSFIKEGGMAKPGYPLVSIESNDRFEALLMVAEEDIQSIKEGQSAKVHIKSQNRFVNATVSEVSRSSKNTGGQFLVKAQIEGDSLNLIAGLFVNAQIKTEQKNESQMVWMPTKALIKNGQLKGVYALGEHNTAILRWLRLGQESQDQIEVLSGLKEGEVIITESNGKLYNGAKVNL